MGSVLQLIKNLQFFCCNCIYSLFFFTKHRHQVEMPNYLLKALNIYKRGGISYLFRCTIDRVFETNAAWWFIRDLSEPIQLHSVTLPIDITSERFNDVFLYMKRKAYIAGPEIKIAKEMGHWFFGLIENGNVKGFCKCGFTNVYVNDFQKIITLPKNLAFIYEYEIDESLRGKGIGYYFISSILHKICNFGYEYALCHIPRWNIGSCRVVEKCGFKRHYFIRYIRLMGIKYTTQNISDLLAKKCTT